MNIILIFIIVVRIHLRVHSLSFILSVDLIQTKDDVGEFPNDQLEIMSLSENPALVSERTNAI